MLSSTDIARRNAQEYFKSMRDQAELALWNLGLIPEGSKTALDVLAFMGAQKVAREAEAVLRKLQRPLIDEDTLAEMESGAHAG